MAPTKSSNKKSSFTSDKEGSGTKTKTKPAVVKELIIRPIGEKSLENYRNYPNVLVTQTTLENLELTKGAFVKVTIGLKELTLLVDIANDDMGGVDDDVVLINQCYLDLYGILLGERAVLNKYTGQLDYAKNVEIHLMDGFEFGIDDLVDVGIVYKGLNSINWYVAKVNEEEDLVTKMRDMELSASNDIEDDDECSNKIGYLVHPKNTHVTFKKVSGNPEVFKKHRFSEIGGVAKTIEQLNKTIKITIENNKLFRSFGIEPPRGILMYGSSGVGKSMILKSVACEYRGCHIVKIDGSSIISKYLGDSEEKVRKSFKEAIKYQPSLVLIDEIDTILPNRKNKEEVSDVEGRIINTFNAMMDELNGSGRVVVIGVTNELGSVDLSLRRPSRFDLEVEIEVPDVDGRYDILSKHLVKIDDELKDITEDEVKEIAGKTHGYVGSDLLSLVRESIMKAINRYLDKKGAVEGEMKVTLLDFERSMKEIRPSAMKEIILEMPHVRWEDIGGQRELKKRLYEMVELPLKEGEKFKSFGIKAPKGILLYGPPGCSKTMTAKALATESGLNFLAVKGPEVFDKYVGESERKIRDIFNKARASSPSIVFIDEIDAIAMDREGGEATNVSKQVLNTILNELDGIEELNGVIIVGATNRPASIDPALLRPGRLDRHVYVGPPDADARREIISKNIARFAIPDAAVGPILQEAVDATDGCSGAECVLLCQEAGLHAICNNKASIDAADFRYAIGEISKNIDEEMIAYFMAFSERRLK